MIATIILLVILVVVAVVILLKAVRIIPQARAGIVERLGKYQSTLSPGLHILVPFIDRLLPMIDLREQVVSFPAQSVITEDNLVVGIDTVVYFQVTDPRSATYEITNYIHAVDELTSATLRNVVGGLNLEETLTSRDKINAELRGVLDSTTGRWGLRVSRVDIKEITPPASIQDSMEKQMRAERDRRAAILTAEGEKQSQILTAEGQRQASVLSAEGDAKAAILRADGEAVDILTAVQGGYEKAAPAVAGGLGALGATLADVLASGAYARHLRGARQAIRHRHEVLLAALAALGLPSAARAQTGDFPGRPVSMVVAFPPGGQADVVARPVAATASRSDCSDQSHISSDPKRFSGRSASLIA